MLGNPTSGSSSNQKHRAKSSWVRHSFFQILSYNLGVPSHDAPALLLAFDCVMMLFNALTSTHSYFYSLNFPRVSAGSGSLVPLQSPSVVQHYLLSQLLEIERRRRDGPMEPLQRWRLKHRRTSGSIFWRLHKGVSCLFTVTLLSLLCLRTIRDK